LPNFLWAKDVVVDAAAARAGAGVPKEEMAGTTGLF